MVDTPTRLSDLETDIDKLDRQFSDLNEVWKAEKAAVLHDHALRRPRASSSLWCWRPSPISSAPR